MTGLGFMTYPCIYRQHVYFLSTPQAREEFTKNPMLYLTQNISRPVVPIRLSIIGPPKSGKTTCKPRKALSSSIMCWRKMKLHMFFQLTYTVYSAYIFDNIFVVQYWIGMQINIHFSFNRQWPIGLRASTAWSDCQLARPWGGSWWNNPRRTWRRPLTSTWWRDWRCRMNWRYRPWTSVSWTCGVRPAGECTRTLH